MGLLKIYQTLDSTNQEANRLLASGRDLNGMGILSLNQTEGRGQYGRAWVAQPGLHLALSIIIQPNALPVSELPVISMKVSLALVKFISGLIYPLIPLIKWPNDIYVEGKKISGILIENSLSSSTVQHCIIGIGMNVNESFFPSDIPNATSLKILTGEEYDLVQQASLLRKAITEIFDHPDENWKEEYDKYIFCLEKQTFFETEGKSFKAKVLGVNHHGKICLELEDRSAKSYFAHKIKWLI